MDFCRLGGVRDSMRLESSHEKSNHGTFVNQTKNCVGTLVVMIPLAFERATRIPIALVTMDGDQDAPSQKEVQYLLLTLHPPVHIPHPPPTLVPCAV